MGLSLSLIFVLVYLKARQGSPHSIGTLLNIVTLDDHYSTDLRTILRPTLRSTHHTPSSTRTPTITLSRLPTDITGFQKEENISSIHPGANTQQSEC
jgi:hypothetical protein